MGLAGVNALRAEGEDAEGVDNAVDFISVLRQASDLGALPVGRRVVVIGGGMTAIDAAIQSKLLGAEEVTIAYRRGKEHMNASEFEQDLATQHGVIIRHWMQPKKVVAQSGKTAAIELEYTQMRDGKLVGLGQTVTLAADQVFKAIGQSFEPASLNGSGSALALENGRIKVDADGRTSLPKVWAGGDCVKDAREDLTVAAVAAGRDAAESIHRSLTSNGRA
jgi:glutamate synthase (NADPH/NADH) small chain